MTETFPHTMFNVAFMSMAPCPRANVATTTKVSQIEAEPKVPLRTHTAK